MRKVHGSMMDAVGARPADAARARWRLAQTLLPGMPTPSHASAALLPATRTLAWQNAFTQLAQRQMAQALQFGAAWPALALDRDTLQQGMALAEAALDQCLTLQAQWLDGLDELGHEMGEVRHANTVSKFVDQEMNLVQQSVMLVSAQATASARLLENIQVNVGWWLSQKLPAAPADPG